MISLSALLLHAHPVSQKVLQACHGKVIEEEEESSEDEDADTTGGSSQSESEDKFLKDYTDEQLQVMLDAEVRLPPAFFSSLILMPDPYPRAPNLWETRTTTTTILDCSASHPVTLKWFRVQRVVLFEDECRR